MINLNTIVFKLRQYSNTILSLDNPNILISRKVYRWVK